MSETVSSPYAIVKPHSLEEASLRAVGWVETDTTEGGWLHMEPTVGAVSVATNPESLDFDLVDAPVLVIDPDDVLVVTAPDMPGDEIDHLRELVLSAKKDPGFLLVSNYDINFQVIKFTHVV